MSITVDELEKKYAGTSYKPLNAQWKVLSIGARETDVSIGNTVKLSLAQPHSTKLRFALPTGDYVLYNDVELEQII